MDDQTLFNWMIGMFAAAFGWWLKTLHARVHRQGDQIAELNVLVAGKYITREELERFMQAIFAKLDRIEDRMDRKADKE